MLIDSVTNRENYYGCLSGHGLEIGALHEPAKLGDKCAVEYFDVRDRESSAEVFGELDSARLVDVNFVGDVDKRDLRELGKDRFDFVIANHVIEHLANPMGLVDDMFWIVKPGGMVVISAPDKRFTFDRERNLTGFEHLVEDFVDECKDAPDEHYLDFIDKVLPEGKGLDGEELQRLLSLVRQRREHVHVWDSASFKEFMSRSLSYLGIGCTLVCEEVGDANEIEYFGIWRKERLRFWHRLYSRFRS